MRILNEAIPTNVLKIELAMRIPEINQTDEVSFNVILHLKICMAYIEIYITMDTYLREVAILSQ